ncbi:MAG: ATP-binding protein [Methanofollis sp.]|uniref:ATP-binding protein n=1 Tax=Methanofollis sp. TaxID=2052835 RepID=UPI0026355AA7|nr:ATP-binding protein [Methanofollis sp.]MDD4255435.1 ATP-binding protein [Methanofollis sp.]
MVQIKSRERNAIIQSLQAGVVPRIGLQHIQVGRKDEINAIITDLDRITDEGATIRFVIGRYGSGKSFFLNLSRLVALEKQFVVVQADITPDRRLHATGGQARALYTELIHSMATRAKPEGSALASVIERWVSDLDYRLKQEGKGDAEVVHAIHQELLPLQDLVSGYDFASVIGRYYEGFQRGDEILMSSALRWLSGEYETKTEARNDLGVRTVVRDQNIYDYLKLWAAFVRMAGYAGLIVNLDEMGVLSHRLNSTQARNANYEMILRIVNDCLQGSVSGIGFIFAGTDEFFADPRRGIASYEALASRLNENEFAVNGLKDNSGPVIRLDNLTPEDLFVLFHNIRNVFARGDPSVYLIPDEGITQFMGHCSGVLGAEFYQTPREAVKKFVGLLSVLEQNPGTRWEDLLSGPSTMPSGDTPESERVLGDDDDLVTFRL